MVSHSGAQGGGGGEPRGSSRSTLLAYTYGTVSRGEEESGLCKQLGLPRLPGMRAEGSCILYSASRHMVSTQSALLARRTVRNVAGKIMT